MPEQDDIHVQVVQEPTIVVVPVQRGAIGPPGPSGQGFEWHGDWHWGEECDPGHVTKHNGTIWVSLTHTTGSDEPSDANPKWAAVFRSSELQGPTGPAGPTIVIETTRRRWFGVGPPTLVVGSSLGDEYVDVNTGDLYTLK